MAKKIRPKDFSTISGIVYEISGLPLDMCIDALAEFLAPEAILEDKGTFRRGWGENAQRTHKVKMAEPIVWKFKRGEGFLATCKVSERPEIRSRYSGPTFRMGKPKESARTEPAAVPMVAKPVPERIAVTQQQKKRAAATMENGNVEDMATETGDLPALPSGVTSSGSGGTDFMLMMKNLLQAELTPMHTSIATMQSQLAHLAPMNNQLQDVANGLPSIQSRVDYMENDNDDEALFGNSQGETSATEPGAATQNGTGNLPARRANPPRSTRREEPYTK